MNEELIQPQKNSFDASVFATPLLVGLLSGFVLLGTEVILYSSIGGEILSVMLVAATIVCGAIIIGSAFLFLLSLPMVLLKRKLAVQCAISSLCLTLPILLAILPSKWLEQNNFERIERNAQPLIEAIQTYQKDNGGDPPKDLEVLIPQYIPKIPFTGNGRCSEYFFEVEKYRSDAGSWALGVDFSVFFLGTKDYLIYWPSQNYPQKLSGLKFQRIGNWAHVSR